MKNISVETKKQGATIIAKAFIKALSDDMYPEQAMEAVLGVKMEKFNSLNVQTMTIGTIVYNVWVGLFKMQIINQQWIEKALLSGDLPKQFEKAVYQFIGNAASKYGLSTGSYMPELIRRGFDKIIWDQNIHKALKLN